MRLRTKFLILFSIISLIPLVLTLLITYTRYQKTLEQDAVKLENQFAATASSKIKTFMVSQIGIINNIATLYDEEFSSDDASLTNESSHGNEDPHPRNLSGATTEIKHILYRSENFTNLSIINQDGKEIIKEDKTLIFEEDDLIDIENSEKFKTIKTKGLYIGPIYRENGKSLFELGRWIVDPENNFKGAVLAKIDAKIIFEIMTNISDTMGAGGHVFIVDEKGEILAHPYETQVLGGEHASHLFDIKNIVLNNKNLEISQKYYNEKREAVLGTAYSITLESTDIKLPQELKTNWFIVVEQKQSVVFKEIYTTLVFFIFIFLCVLILVALSAIYFAKGISAPVEMLHIATKEYTKGNLLYRTKIETNDEIGDLADNFNKMAGTIASSIEDIRQEEKMKSDFIAIAAHQLRTPLTGLKWSIDFLISEDAGKLNLDQKQMIEKAFRATKQMVDLVNDLLNISKIEEGHFNINLKKQSILQVFENIKNMFQNTKENNIILKINDIPTLPLLNIDDKKIEMALENIIDNAIKYSPPGGTVELKVVYQKQEVVISVKDSGIGISKNEKERIFTKFFRSKEALIKHPDGSGLGLYISKNIIEQHKGKMWFDSKENEGTTFYISLPVTI